MDVPGHSDPGGAAVAVLGTQKSPLRGAPTAPAPDLARTRGAGATAAGVGAAERENGAAAPRLSGPADSGQPSPPSTGRRWTVCWARTSGAMGTSPCEAAAGR